MRDSYSLTALASMVALAACGSPSPPSCEAAVRHATTLSGADGDQDVPGLVAQCLRERWTATVRGCLTAARSSAEATSCITGREPGAPAAPRSSTGAVPAGDPKEAELNLGAIEKANLMNYAEAGGFVAGSTGWTPRTPCCEAADHRCPVDPAAWTGAWRALLFETTKAHAFRYRYKGTATSYEVQATGDLDCDGASITFTLRGGINAAGQPTSEFIRPTKAD